MAKIKTRWQKRHVDNCGFYENDIFCETGEFGKDWDNETTKQAYWQMAIYTKMANLRKWGIGQESISGLAKHHLRWQRGEYWEKVDFDKYGESARKNHQGFGQIFKWDDKKGHVDSWRFLGQWQILQRWRIWQEVIKGLTKIYKEMTKRGILTNGDYNKNGKLGNISFKVCQNSNEMTNEACR